MDNEREEVSSDGELVERPVEPIAWLVEELLVLCEMLARATPEDAPVHLDRYALSERVTQTKQLDWITMRWVPGGQSRGLVNAHGFLNNLFGHSSDFPISHGVNVDLVSAKWNSMTDEEQQTLFTQIMTVADAGIPPTREAFEQVGILITDGFE